MKLSELQRGGARDYHRQRALNSAKMRLLSLAYDAVQDNPDLTRNEFIAWERLKILGLSRKSIVNYLVDVPFKKEPRQLKVKEDENQKDIWYLGYQASTQGLKFHQLLRTHK